MGSNNRSTSSVVRDNTDAAVLAFLSSLNSPRSLTVWLLYAYGEHDQLVELTCNPRHYISHVSFRDDYAATSLLSKADFLKTSFCRKDKALEKFLLAEKRCRTANDLVVPYAPDGSFPPEALHPLIPRVRRQIKRILGSFDIEEMLERSDWGPGVSTLLKGPASVKPNKYQKETGMTLEVHNVIWPLLHVAYPSWHREILTKVSASVEMGNVVVTVPKNSKTDRVIAVEPGWNLWFQKGIGGMIRRRLLRCGCNLDYQTRNQNLAKDAVFKGLSTIDFSSASDTIAREVVRLLVPHEWFRILDLFRCRRGKLPDGTITHWEKFSSMGNGFTFELESMIFYAIGLVVAEAESCETHDVSVYGDDVILPFKAVPRFVELSELLGFSVNRQKSFFDGVFFESCGAHWFDGHDVKPFYLDQRVDTVPKCYGFHNRVMEFAHRCCGANWGLDSRFKQVTKQLRSLVHSEDYNLVPVQFGDVGFFSNLDHALALRTTRVVRMIGYKIRIRTEVAVKLYFDGYGLILDRIRGTHDLRGAELRERPLSTFMNRGVARTWLSSHHPRRSPAPKQGRPGSMFESGGSNLVPLKTTTKTVLRFPIVGAGQWFDFGGWV